MVAGPGGGQGSNRAAGNTGPGGNAGNSSNTWGVAVLERAAAESSPAKYPLGELKHVSSLIVAAGAKQQLKQLQEDGYTQVRNVRGDGNCFYRAMGFAFLETLACSSQMNKKAKHERLQSVLLPSDLVAEIEKKSPPEFKELIKQLKDGVTENPPRKLHASLMQDQRMDLFIVWLVRQVVARRMRSDRDKNYQPHFDGTLAELSSSANNGVSLEEYIESEVLPMGKEAETLVQMVSSYVFEVRLNIVPLDEENASHQKTYTYPTDVYEPPPHHGAIHLLFKPGHYDLLYKIAGAVPTDNGLAGALVTKAPAAGDLKGQSICFPQLRELEAPCSFCTVVCDLTKGVLLAHGNCFHRFCANCAPEVENADACPLCETPIITSEDHHQRHASVMQGIMRNQNAATSRGTWAARANSAKNMQSPIKQQPKPELGFKVFGLDDTEVIRVPMEERRRRLDQHLRLLANQLTGLPPVAIDSGAAAGGNNTGASGAAGGNANASGEHSAADGEGPNFSVNFPDRTGSESQQPPNPATITGGISTSLKQNQQNALLNKKNQQLASGPTAVTLGNPGKMKIEERVLYSVFFSTGDWGADRILLANKQEAKFINGSGRRQRISIEKRSGALVELLGKNERQVVVIIGSARERALALSYVEILRLQSAHMASMYLAQVEKALSKCWQYNCPLLKPHLLTELVLLQVNPKNSIRGMYDALRDVEHEAGGLCVCISLEKRPTSMLADHIIFIAVDPDKMEQGVRELVKSQDGEIVKKTIRSVKPAKQGSPDNANPPAGAPNAVPQLVSRSPSETEEGKATSSAESATAFSSAGGPAVGEQSAGQSADSSTAASVVVPGEASTAANTAASDAAQGGGFPAANGGSGVSSHQNSITAGSGKASASRPPVPNFVQAGGAPPPANDPMTQNEAKLTSSSGAASGTSVATLDPSQQQAGTTGVEQEKLEAAPPASQPPQVNLVAGGAAENPPGALTSGAAPDQKSRSNSMTSYNRFNSNSDNSSLQHSSSTTSATGAAQGPPAGLEQQGELRGGAPGGVLGGAAPQAATTGTAGGIGGPPLAAGAGAYNVFNAGGANTGTAQAVGTTNAAGAALATAGSAVPGQQNAPQGTATQQGVGANQMLNVNQTGTAPHLPQGAAQQGGQPPQQNLYAAPGQGGHTGAMGQMNAQMGQQPQNAQNLGNTQNANPYAGANQMMQNAQQQQQQNQPHQGQYLGMGQHLTTYPATATAQAASANSFSQAGGAPTHGLFQVSQTGGAMSAAGVTGSMSAAMGGSAAGNQMMNAGQQQSQMIQQGNNLMQAAGAQQNAGGNQMGSGAGNQMVSQYGMSGMAGTNLLAQQQGQGAGQHHMMVGGINQASVVGGTQQQQNQINQQNAVQMGQQQQQQQQLMQQQLGSAGTSMVQQHLAGAVQNMTQQGQQLAQQQQQNHYVLTQMQQQIQAQVGQQGVGAASVQVSALAAQVYQAIVSEQDQGLKFHLAYGNDPSMIKMHQQLAQNRGVTVEQQMQQLSQQKQNWLAQRQLTPEQFQQCVNEIRAFQQIQSQMKQQQQPQQLTPQQQLTQQQQQWAAQQAAALQQVAQQAQQQAHNRAAGMGALGINANQTGMQTGGQGAGIAQQQFAAGMGGAAGSVAGGAPAGQMMGQQNTQQGVQVMRQNSIGEHTTISGGGGDNNLYSANQSQGGMQQNHQMNAGTQQQQHGSMGNNIATQGYGNQAQVNHGQQNHGQQNQGPNMGNMNQHANSGQGMSNNLSMQQPHQDRTAMQNRPSIEDNWRSGPRNNLNNPPPSASKGGYNNAHQKGHGTAAGGYHHQAGNQSGVSGNHPQRQYGNNAYGGGNNYGGTNSNAGNQGMSSQQMGGNNWNSQMGGGGVGNQGYGHGGQYTNRQDRSYSGQTSGQDHGYGGGAGAQSQVGGGGYNQNMNRSAGMKGSGMNNYGASKSGMSGSQSHQGSKQTNPGSSSTGEYVDRDAAYAATQRMAAEFASLPATSSTNPHAVGGGDAPGAAQQHGGSSSMGGLGGANPPPMPNTRGYGQQHGGYGESGYNQHQGGGGKGGGYNSMGSQQGRGYGAQARFGSNSWRNNEQWKEAEDKTWRGGDPANSNLQGGATNQQQQGGGASSSVGPSGGGAAVGNSTSASGAATGSSSTEAAATGSAAASSSTAPNAEAETPCLEGLAALIKTLPTSSGSEGPTGPAGPAGAAGSSKPTEAPSSAAENTSARAEGSTARPEGPSAAQKGKGQMTPVETPRAAPLPPAANGGQTSSKLSSAAGQQPGSGSSELQSAQSGAGAPDSSTQPPPESVVSPIVLNSVKQTGSTSNSSVKRAPWYKGNTDASRPSAAAVAAGQAVKFSAGVSPAGGADAVVGGGAFHHPNNQAAATNPNTPSASSSAVPVSGSKDGPGGASSSVNGALGAVSGAGGATSSTAPLKSCEEGEDSASATGSTTNKSGGGKGGNAAAQQPNSSAKADGKGSSSTQPSQPAGSEAGGKDSAKGNGGKDGGSSSSGGKENNQGKGGKRGQTSAVDDPISRQQGVQFNLFREHFCTLQQAPQLEALELSAFNISEGVLWQSNSNPSETTTKGGNNTHRYAGSRHEWWKMAATKLPTAVSACKFQDADQVAHASLSHECVVEQYGMDRIGLRWEELDFLYNRADAGGAPPGTSGAGGSSGSRTVAGNSQHVDKVELMQHVCGCKIVTPGNWPDWRKDVPRWPLALLGRRQDRRRGRLLLALFRLQSQSPAKHLEVADVFSLPEVHHVAADLRPELVKLGTTDPLKTPNGISQMETFFKKTLAVFPCMRQSGPRKEYYLLVVRNRDKAKGNDEVAPTDSNISKQTARLFTDGADRQNNQRDWRGKNSKQVADPTGKASSGATVVSPPEIKDLLGNGYDRLGVSARPRPGTEDSLILPKLKELPKMFFEEKRPLDKGFLSLVSEGKAIDVLHVEGHTQDWFAQRKALLEKATGVVGSAALTLTSSGGGGSSSSFAENSLSQASTTVVSSSSKHSTASSSQNAQNHQQQALPDASPRGAGTSSAAAPHTPGGVTPGGGTTTSSTGIGGAPSAAGEQTVRTAVVVYGTLEARVRFRRYLTLSLGQLDAAGMVDLLTSGPCAQQVLVYTTKTGGYGKGNRQNPSQTGGPKGAEELLSKDENSDQLRFTVWERGVRCQLLPIKEIMETDDAFSYRVNVQQ